MSHSFFPTAQERQAETRKFPDGLQTGSRGGM